MTSLTKANKASESLRTTVPAGIIKQFDLREGDKLRWKIVPGKDGNILVQVEAEKGERD